MEISETDYEVRILRSVRRIIRAVDIHSRRINSKFNVTVPQMLCLYSLARRPEKTMSELSRDVNLGASTVNGIADRLEAKSLVRRQRSKKDRRKVYLELTDHGKEIIKKAPPLLQETVEKQLRKLPELEQAAIALSMERMVLLMEAEDIDASPNLLPG
ncbi:MarR family winged helix-turn-helix transcriptional regulator [Sedimentisphaera salicampi]|uniref:Regulator of autolytic activity n=1 Tax=Sedimentisphaera salicampi TaxID=1941349 RepID=A0A1W6LNX9_9BACT|nr:MarR family transcriptional regulator [Sedimentisphaera salicampi]ARN57484.1 Regulator of autolytic activity [Sedimentisphaera salicampi]OXU14495.1 Regulator of autolytic activity [Sedimentisphaera salicampi]